MLDSQGGIIRLFFGIILVFIGVVLWLFLQGKAKNYYMRAIKFDSGLSDVLVANGIDDSNIVSQQRLKKKSGFNTWIEFNKEIKLNNKTDLSKIRQQTELLAKKSTLEFYQLKASSDAVTFEIKQKDKVFSRVTFLQTHGPGVLLEKSKTPFRNKKLVAIVIDDVGYKEDLSEFLSLGIPVNFAVLPKERYSARIAAKLNSLKMPFIMHLPMEPEKYPAENPGKFALLLKMNGKEIEKIFNEDLNSLKGAAGVSNHMGSAFTADKEKMGILLNLVKKENLFFLDSYTSQNSKAKKTANEIGLKNLRNDIFIDVKDEPDSINKQLAAVMKTAQKYGQCIAIGHFHRKYVIPALKENLEKFKENNIEFVYLKDLF
ncbi:MAG: divergent polysaccharide deacetylase family protein [Elusimicrobia bacterium]|nr:divergent polysaccharide deacetylase family protein [Candidatus Liberimonas magnetica]